MLETLLAFLLSFMPASDRADYTEDFFRGNVQEAIDARNEAAWTLPDDIFQHFVLPIRVNNENLDSARFYFHKELAPIVKGRSMRDAVLEVNHWCHEHVTYQPSDARTSAPLATLKTAWGRCGEESTFLVSALRSVAIPARQVYTPRWAHTDDNHAWVEAWVDGEWCFLGACEPEPVLNLGWFNAPASRGLLMHTKVFGDWHGPEEVMSRTHQYTEINVISNYAQCATATVEVHDANGRPVTGADVNWQIYNYADFYTVSHQQSDAQAQSTLTAGLGDMMITAYKDGAFGFAKVNFRDTSKPTIVTLNHKIGEAFEEDFDIVPPSEHNNQPLVTPEMRAENDRRLAYEDSIRLAYRATFPTLSKLIELGITDATEQQLILTSEGNYQTLLSFLNNTTKTGGDALRHRAVELLQTLTEKDLRDVPAAVLDDHLLNTSLDASAKHVLCPRIFDEMLTPWRSSLLKEMQQTFSAEQLTQFHQQPSLIADWCKENIKVQDDLTIGGTYTTPMGSWRSRTSDSKSLPILFVAMCRVLGIEAWIDTVTGNTFYLTPNSSLLTPNLIVFGDSDKNNYLTGTLSLAFEPQKYVADPEYARHFSLSRYDGSAFSLLAYDDFMPLSTSFSKGMEVEAGYYLLTTGQRMADGSVLAHVSGFTVSPNSQTSQVLQLRQDENAVSVIGSFNSEARYTSIDGQDLSVLQTTGRGYFVVGLLGVGQEPTNHALKDIALRRQELEAWGRTLLLLFPSRQDYDKYMKDPIAGLPSNVVFGIDESGAITSEIRQGMKLDEQTPLPYILIGDTFNRVVFESHGYTIGLGDQLVKVIKDISTAQQLPWDNASAEPYVPTAENLAEREAFQDTHFGIFLHWGLYAMLATGEWTMTNKDLHYQEYQKLAGGFYPASFNANEWISAFKDAGAGYICLTSRHHDGFSMWNTTQSDYNIVKATPFKRDVVAELAEACHKQDLRFHLYYSLIDWWRDDCPRGRTGLGTGRPGTGIDYPHYYQFMKDQLQELLTNYGKVGAIWFDGVWDQDQHPDFDWHLRGLYDHIHALQPQCLVGNNHHLSVMDGEDIQIFERDLPGENTAGLSGQNVSRLPLETCQTMNGMWGYKITDQDYKSTRDLIHYLVRACGLGANLLLNIGPQPDGRLPETALLRLKEMGQWMRQYGESIKGTREGEIAPQEWGVTTRRGKDLYVHLLNYSDDTLLLPLTTKLRSAICLNNGQTLKLKRTKEGYLLSGLSGIEQDIDRIIKIN